MQTIVSILILSAITSSTTAILFSITNPPPPHPRGLHLQACAEYASASKGTLAIDVDAQRQYFALSHLKTLSDVRAMANYFVTSFFLTQHRAKTQLYQALFQRSSVSLSPRHWKSSAGTIGCVVKSEKVLIVENKTQTHTSKTVIQPNKQQKITLVYQMNYSSPDNHREWLDEIINGGDDIIVEEVWDGHWRVLADHAIIVYHTASCEKKNAPLLEYLQHFDRLSLAYGIIHLHDERIDGCRSHYPMARFILRNNMHPSMRSNQHILEIPIGYSNGAGRNRNRNRIRNRNKQTPHIQPTDRPLIWNFMGDIESKPHRKNTIARMIELFQDQDTYHLTLTKIWNDENRLTTENYCKIMSNSIFSPSPIGTVYKDGNLPNGLGAMRTWEALEQGSLPILENWRHENWRQKYTNYLYVGRYNVQEPIPLLIVNQEWSNVGKVLQPYVTNPQKLNSLWKKTMAWYARIKTRTRHAVQSFIIDRLFESRQYNSALEHSHCTIFHKNAYYTMKCEAEI